MRIPFQDLKQSIRSLRQSPVFALTAILTLAIGIGAVASVFSVVDSVLLKPFGFPQPQQLVVLRETVVKPNVPGPDNYNHFLNWKRNAKTLSGAAIFQNHAYSVAFGTAHPHIVDGLAVSPGFFSVLGVPPMLGRGFQAADAIKGNPEVAILSWSAWQRYFHGDPGAVGRTLHIGGTPQIVIGVLPEGFHFPHMEELANTMPPSDTLPYEIFTPLVVYPSMAMSIDGDYDYLALARLRPGVSPTKAQGEIDGLQANFRKSAHLPEHLGAVVEPLRQEVTGNFGTGLWILLGAVGAVLLIGCANLANLQLARAVARERELAVRAALGAGRGRLVWSTLSESVVLSAVGGALGILLAFAGVRLLIAAAPASVPRLDQASMSWPVLLGAAVLSILTTLLAGALPALRGLRVQPQSAMQTNPSRVSSSREGSSARNFLIGGEVACTVVLLIVTLLLVHSLTRLLTQGRDFDSDQVTLAQVDLYVPQYGDDKANSAAVRVAFIDRALSGLRQLPGVESVAMTSAMPMGGESWIDSIFRPDHPVRPGHEPEANMRWVSPDYLVTLKIPLLEGRALTAYDRDHPTNALISRQAARAIWPGLDPIGRTFTLGQDAKFTVVGIVADARINDLRSIENMLYIPFWQNPGWRAYFLIRSARPASSLAGSIRRVIWGIDPQVAIQALKPLNAQVDDSVATARFGTLLLSCFGAAALLLAALGIYGVNAYSVSLRYREFGIRMALGCNRAALVRLVVRQASLPVAAGAIAGLLLSSAAAHGIGSLLYDTKPGDPRLILLGLALMAVVALLAALLPARRAATVNPIQALRAE